MQGLLARHWPRGEDPSLLFCLAAFLPGCLNVFLNTWHPIHVLRGYFAALRCPLWKRHARQGPPRHWGLAQWLLGRYWPPGEDPSLLLGLMAFLLRLLQRLSECLVFLPLCCAPMGETCTLGASRDPTSPLGQVQGLLGRLWPPGDDPSLLLGFTASLWATSMSPCKPVVLSLSSWGLLATLGCPSWERNAP